MQKMTVLEETRYRLACCAADTGDGWGEDRSLRNHLQCRVKNRLDELTPFVEEIEALDEDHELRSDETVLVLLQEHVDLERAKSLANDYLGIEEGIEALIATAETKAEETARLQACLQKLGFKP